MNNLLSFASGKKTYLVAALMFVYALTGLLLGKLSPNEAGQILFNALGLTGLRSAVQKAQDSK